MLVSPILLVRQQTALEYMDNNTPAAPANKPAIENMDVKYAQCMMHSALSSFTNHLLEGGVDPTANVFIAADDADACQSD